MTDPQPSCSEIARKIAFESSAKHGYEEASLRGWQEEQITEALQAKQKTIEEKDALIINGMKLANQEIAEKQATIESLRAEVATLKRIDDVGIITNQNQHSEIDKLKAQLSRLKEILKGRDAALRNLIDPDECDINRGFCHLHACPEPCANEVAKQALSKTWEEGV